MKRDELIVVDVPVKPHGIYLQLVQRKISRLSCDDVKSAVSNSTDILVQDTSAVSPLAFRHFTLSSLKLQLYSFHSRGYQLSYISLRNPIFVICQ